MGHHPKEVRLLLGGPLGGDAVVDRAGDLQVVLSAVTERRDLDAEDIQAVIEILAEFTRLHHLQQIAVGGADDPDVHRDDRVVPHPADLLFLQDPEQRGLKFQGQFADLVQKDGAAVGRFKQAGLAALPRAGEGGIRVAKELGLHQIAVEGGAVDRHKRPALPGTGIVDALGEHLFSGAGLSVEHDGQLGVCKKGRELLGLQNRGRGAQNIRKVVFGHQALLVQLDSDVPLCGLQSLDVLKGGHDALDLSADTDRDAVGGDKCAVDVHDLADLRLAGLENVGQTGVGQHLFDWAAREGGLGGAEHLVRNLIGGSDPAGLVDGNDGIVGVVQNILVPLQTDLELLLGPGIFLLGFIELLGGIQSPEDGDV